MNHRRLHRLGHPQAGGITIVVALMLLVLLTVAALAMSRNALREIVSTGLSRQGAMARNTADSGLEWSLFWIDLANAKTATGTALAMSNMKTALLQNPTWAGVAQDITSDITAPTKYVPGNSVATDLSLPVTTTAAGTVTQGFTVGLTSMGKLPITMTSQSVGSSGFTPASGALPKQAPDLWAIRSDAQVVQGGITFVHAKELWVSTPIQ